MRTVCTLGLVFLMWTGTAAAQEITEQPRTGLLIGFGINTGDISCEGCDGFDEAVGLEFHLGWMLGQRLSLVWDSWGMTHRGDNFSVTHGISAVGAQFWLVPRIWIKGGLGVAQGTISVTFNGNEFSESTDRVPAVMVGAGWEVVTGRRFALDVQLRAGTGFYDEADAGGNVRNVGVGVGLTWF